MSEELKKVLISCPICHKSGNVKVPTDIVKSKRTGLSTITVERRICDHTFLIYVDKNFNMRESEKIDYIQAPSIIAEVDKPKEIVFTTEEIENLSTNFYPLMLSYILKSLFFNQKIAIVLENKKESLIPIFEKFLEYIFKDTFNIHYYVVSYDTYVSTNKRSKCNIVIQDIDILKDQYNILKDGEFGVERGFIQKLYDGDFKKETIKDLTLDIENAFILSKFVSDLLDEKKRLNINKIIKNLKSEFSIEIDVRYAEFLVSIVKHYYDKKVKHLYKNVEVMKFKKLGK